MSRIVVDASVAAKWFFPEPHSGEAAKLLTGRRALLAPDLIHAEFGNVVWKRARRAEITAEQAAGIIDDFLRIPLEIAPSEHLLPSAMELALRTGRTVYDSLYLALALAIGCPLITGDERLVNALSRQSLPLQLIWVGSPA